VEDLSCEIIVPHQLAPLDMEQIVDSVLKTRRTVVVEEGVKSWGWGAEVIAGLAHVRHEAPPGRVGARELPIPASRELEDQVLPQVGDIIAAAIHTVDTSLV
jgi:pyruvate dehydrogenase E1 component beta subunit